MCMWYTWLSFTEPLVMSDIYEATKALCIEEQEDAARSAMYAREYRDLDGLMGLAAQEQRVAAYHAHQAMFRLLHLTGAA